MKKISVIQGIINHSAWTEEQKLYFIQSYLLNWITEEQLQEVYNVAM